MFTSRNIAQCSTIAALVIAALLTANSRAQISTATTTTQGGSPVNGAATTGATASGAAATGTAATAGQTTAAALQANSNVPMNAAQNVVSESLGLTFANTPGSGLTISGISDTSALGTIGLQAGDRIMAVNGHPAGSGMSLLNELSRIAGSNQSASLTVTTSAGTRQVLNVPGSSLQSIVQARATIGSGRGPGGNAAQQNNVGQNLVSQSLGLTFANTGNGLVISSIAPNSPLQNLGLQPGDQITSLNGQPINSPSDLSNQLASAVPSVVTSTGASLGFIRNGEQIHTTVPTATLQSIARAQAQFGGGRAMPTAQNANATSNTGAAQTNISGDQQAAVNAVSGFNPGTTAFKPATTALPNATTLPSAATGITSATGAQAVTPGLGTTTAQSAGGQAIATGQPMGVGQGTATAPGQATAPGTATLSAQGGSAIPAAGTAGAARGSGWAKFNDAEYRALGLPVPPGTPTVPMPIPGPNTPDTNVNQTDANVNQTAGANATTAPGAISGVQPAGAQSSLPTTVITPSGPRIAVPGQARAPGRSAAGGVPGAAGPAGKAAPGAAKGGGKANGGGARGGGGARNTGGGSGGGAKGGGS